MSWATLYMPLSLVETSCLDMSSADHAVWRLQGPTASTSRVLACVFKQQLLSVPIHRTHVMMPQISNRQRKGQAPGSVSCLDALFSLHVFVSWGELFSLVLLELVQASGKGRINGCSLLLVHGTGLAHPCVIVVSCGVPFKSDRCGYRRVMDLLAVLAYPCATSDLSRESPTHPPHRLYRPAPSEKLGSAANCRSPRFRVPVGLRVWRTHRDPPVWLFCFRRRVG